MVYFEDQEDFIHQLNFFLIFARKTLHGFEDGTSSSGDKHYLPCYEGFVTGLCDPISNNLATVLKALCSSGKYSVYVLTHWKVRS